MFRLPAAPALARAAGLCMVPVNLLVGLLSAAVSDRALVSAALLLTIAGLAALTLATSGAAFYFAGGITLFVGESVHFSIVQGGDVLGALHAAWRACRTTHHVHAFCGRILV